jgi:hypothetical protein
MHPMKFIITVILRLVGLHKSHVVTSQCPGYQAECVLEPDNKYERCYWLFYVGLKLAVSPGVILKEELIHKVFCVSLNLSFSPETKNILRRKNMYCRNNIYRRYFICESESKCLTGSQEGILKEEHIPKEFCV